MNDEPEGGEMSDVPIAMRPVTELKDVDLWGVRSIHMHPDTIATFKLDSLPLFAQPLAWPPGNPFLGMAIDIISNRLVPVGMLAFDPPAHRRAER